MPELFKRALPVAAGVGIGVLAGAAWRSPQARFARMSGTTIVAPDAALWTTDFLNAAYYRRDPAEREVADMRLAFGILTTFWHENDHRRIRATDAVAFHRAFGRARFIDGATTVRGTLNREQLLQGATKLLGPWFPEAWADPARRGWGIAFRTPEDRAAYRPEVRLEQARLGPLTPETAPPKEQTWHTYPPVEVASADAVIAALSATETWPDYASETGRFTPLRAGGLEGQTMEIEVVAGASGGRPVITRGYVTISSVVTQADPVRLEAYVAALNDGLARFGKDEPAAVPDGATPILGFDLVTHEGHFMGSGRNRLVLFEQDGRAFARAAGTWDPMPWHLQQVYDRAGSAAQHAFWGQGAIIEQSMLHQIAIAVGTPVEGA